MASQNVNASVLHGAKDLRLVQNPPSLSSPALRILIDMLRKPATCQVLQPTKYRLLSSPPASAAQICTTSTITEMETLLFASP